MEDQQDQDQDHKNEKIINEGIVTRGDCGSSQAPEADIACPSRIQDMEEERAVSLRHDPQHSSGMAYTYNPVAAR